MWQPVGESFTQGVRMCLVLSECCRSSAEYPSEGRHEQHGGAMSRNILIVDDDEAIRRLLVKLLADHYELAVAANR